ncbi:MAG: TolC family protein [Acidimicrobiia bacterium]|nr:TolC family protein [Acidimicrobiia bacterium]
MNRTTLCFVLVVSAAALGPLPALAQDAERVDGLARDAAARFERALAGGQTTRTVPPVAGATTDLTLDEATARALERNLDIAVERLNPQTFDFSIASLDASYRPTFSSQFGLRNATTFSRSQTAGAVVLETATLTGNSGLSQNLKWGGGQLSVTFNNNRLKQSDAFALRNPTLNTSFSAVMVQPLLRGFRIDGTRSQLVITHLNQEISEIALKGTIVATLAGVRNAYWDLVYAVQAVDVAQRSLALATKLVDDNRARVEVGTLAPIDVVQAQSEEALRRQALVQAEATHQTAELALKRLLVSGTDDPLWSASINPVDRPIFSTESLDVEGAVRRALQQRTDLQQSLRQLESNDVSIRNLSDQRLPALDLTASYGASGIGGPQFVRQGLGGLITDTIPSGWGDALGTLAHLTAPQWNLALNLSYPIGASTADANLARARVQKQQTLAQSRKLELQIATEVTNSALQVQNSLTAYQAALASRELAQQRLDAETSKFEVGMSTNFFVVQAQRDLADAQNAELRALLNYRKALVDFQRVQEAPAGGGSGGGVTAVSGGTGGATTTRSTAGGGGGFGGF